MPRILLLLVLCFTGYALPSLSQERQAVVLEFAGTVDYCWSRQLEAAEKRGDSDLASKITIMRNKAKAAAYKYVSPTEYDAYVASGIGSGLFATVAKEEGGCGCIIVKLASRKRELVDRACSGK